MSCFKSGRLQLLSYSSCICWCLFLLYFSVSVVPLFSSYSCVSSVLIQICFLSINLWISIGVILLLLLYISILTFHLSSISFEFHINVFIYMFLCTFAGVSCSSQSTYVQWVLNRYNVEISNRSDEKQSTTSF